MIVKRVIRDEADTKDLLETYSDEDYKLKQVETDKIYGHSVVDVIEGYDKDNQPYAKYTYIETDEKDIEPEIESETESI